MTINADFILGLGTGLFIGIVTVSLIVFALAILSIHHKLKKGKAVQ